MKLSSGSSIASVTSGTESGVAGVVDIGLNVSVPEVAV